MRYIFGDIHGCIKTLKELVRIIMLGDEQPELFFVGDLIDRGPDSKAVIDYIIELNRCGIKAESVRGNHEEMLIHAYERNQKISDSKWSVNGAEATIKSFDVKADLNNKVNELIPEKYFQFCSNLPYFIELSDYFIVHAGFNFKIGNPFTDFETMVWTREDQYNEALTKGKRIIHGHSPVSLEKLKIILQKDKPNIINVDTGCVYPQHKGLGNLTAFNIDTFTVVFLKNIDII